MQFLCTCISLIIVFATRNARGTNVALGRPATQSSTWFGFYTAGRAVDGNSGMRFIQDTCTHTACYDHKPNWVVNLGKMHTINSVTIYNPDTAYGRLHDIKIEVFKMDPNTPGATGQLCNTIGSVPVTSGTPIIVRCPTPLSGQYVKLEKTVWRPTMYNHYCDALVMCEVQVEGTPINNPGPNPGPIVCPIGFESHHGSCYHFASDYVQSWFAARMACQTIGGDLAVIESKEENDYIKGKLLAVPANGHKAFFVGLHKLHDHATWKWIDPNAVQGVPAGGPNNPNPFSDWAAGHGAISAANHCLAMDRNGAADPFAWFQADCNTDHNYVCELSPTFPPK